MKPFPVALAAFLFLPACAPRVALVPVETDGAPAAIGPYSQGVRAGRTLYVAGQIGLDPVSGALVTGGVRAETERALANVGAVLAAAGYGWGDVAKVEAYLVDLGDFAAFNEVYARVLGPHRPARATVGVAALPRGARVEVVVLHATGRSDHDRDEAEHRQQEQSQRHEREDAVDTTDGHVIDGTRGTRRRGGHRAQTTTGAPSCR